MFETIVMLLALIGITILEGISVGTGLAAMFIAAVFWAAALALLLKGRKPAARELGLKAAAYTLLIALLFGLNLINGRVGKQGAERITAACEAYKTRNGAYPEALQQLVPEYLKYIPPAKLSLRWSHYWLRDNKLMFASEPGMVVSFYDLNAKEWGFVPTNKMFDAKKGG